MALIIEDGTGKIDAESFVSVAEFRTYCTNRGIDLTGVLDVTIEIWLRESAEYLCIIVSYRGAKLVGTQALEFPRSDCVDYTGLVITGVPKRLKDAQLYLASEQKKGVSLLEALERGGRVTSEKVGELSVSYAADAPAGTTFPRALNLVAPFVRSGTPDGGPPVPELNFTPPQGGALFDFPSSQYMDVSLPDV